MVQKPVNEVSCLSPESYFMSGISLPGPGISRSLMSYSKDLKTTHRFKNAKETLFICIALEQIRYTASELWILRGYLLKVMLLFELPLMGLGRGAGC